MSRLTPAEAAKQMRSLLEKGRPIPGHLVVAVLGDPMTAITDAGRSILTDNGGAR